jgi:hypothetical protein
LNGVRKVSEGGVFSLPSDFKLHEGWGFIFPIKLGALEEEFPEGRQELSLSPLL